MSAPPDSAPHAGRSGAQCLRFVRLTLALSLQLRFLGRQLLDAGRLAVINGFLAPPLLVLIMLIANNRQVIGRRVNGWANNALGWLTVVVMGVAAVALVLTWGDTLLVLVAPPLIRWLTT